MPYVSQAQRGFFHTAAARKAGITPAMTQEWDQASKGQAHLPAHAAKDKAPHHSSHSHTAAAMRGLKAHHQGGR